MPIVERVVKIGEPLTVEDAVAVARHKAIVELAPSAWERMRASERALQQLLAANQGVYGLNTGLGDLIRKTLPPDQLLQFQRNVLMSHSTGVGEACPEEVARAMMLLMAHGLAQGCSGIRPEVVQTLVDLLNRGVTPWMPLKGSVGYLVGPAHVGLVMMGLGKAFVDGRLVAGHEALGAKGIAPVTFGPKEALALINGTYEITAFGILALHDAQVVTLNADVTAAMSMEALRATDRWLDERVLALRPHRGQQVTGANLRRLLAGSEIIAQARGERIQDALSLRCVPQVHGAVRDLLAYVRQALETELNAVTDNPILVPVEAGAVEVLVSGNGHGAPVAVAMDLLSLAMGQLSSITERRIDRLTNRHVSGLPEFLVARPGINSGVMLAQYAAAALAAETKALAHPSSLDTIPTCAFQEDHVSMGVTCARQAREAVDNARYVVAIEAFAAAQGLEFLRPLRPGRGTLAAWDALRERVPPLEEDRPLTGDIETVSQLIGSGEWLRQVEDVVGPLHR